MTLSTSRAARTHNNQWCCLHQMHDITPQIPHTNLIAAYIAIFLVNIFHLPLSRLYLASLEKASLIHTWPAGRLWSRELEDTCTNVDGWHEWKWFQIGDAVLGFPTRSIAHNKANKLNAEWTIFSCAQTCQSKGKAVYGVWGNLWISIDLKSK